MDIPDVKVFEAMLKLAAMEEKIEHIAEYIDNGVMNQRIETAVKNGVKGCPFYIEQKAKKKIASFTKWIIPLCISVVTTLLVIWRTVGFHR